MTDLQREVSLLHEAAHALARAALGWPSAGVEVDGSGGGETHGTGNTYPQWEMAKVAMAGPAVEQRFLKRTSADMFTAWLETIDASEWEERATDDVATAGVFAGAGYAWAVGLLAAHWADVERIAAALSIRGALTSHEVSDLLASVVFDERAIARSTDSQIVMDWAQAWNQR